MLTAKKKTNIIPTHRIVVVLIVSVVRDVSSSVMNKPDIKMAAKARRTSSTLMLPGRSEKVGRVPTNVLDREDVFLVSRFEIQKTSPKSNAVQ